MTMNWELRGELLEQIGEPAHVLLVKRGVDLVQEAERRWLDHVDREHQRDACEGLLPAREEVDVLQLLPRGLRKDLDAGLQGRIGVLQAKLRPAAAEQSSEDRVKVLLDLVVRLEEELGGLRLDLRGDLLQILARMREVLELAR